MNNIIKGTPYDQERAFYGEEACEHVYEMLKKRNIYYETTKSYFGRQWTPEIDLKHGDIIILKKYWFDIKRNSITERSMMNFNGIGYFLFHHNLNKSIFITKKTLYKIMPELPPKVRVSSGEFGYKYRFFYNYSFMTLEDFFDNIIIPNMMKLSPLKCI